MARPQGAELPPIVSIKLCGSKKCSENVRSGVLEFSSENRHAMTGMWPMDTNDYGTGYDLYVLDGEGYEKSDAAMFNVKMDC
mmetsp:Transcript_22126/g.44762  ORF Transcript_22126/g.44762 Transcript_22126/m.44762 type:complete len:82 (+) Transcript_22126:3-248(+)